MNRIPYVLLRSAYSTCRGGSGMKTRGCRDGVSFLRRMALPLAFTRYCSTLNLYCGGQSSFYCPPHLQSLPYCNATTRPLRNIRSSPTSPVNAIHHTILVMAISCKGQRCPRRPFPSSSVPGHPTP